MDTQQQESENNRQPESTQPPRNGKLRLVVLAVVLVLGIGALVYWLMGRGKVTTEDAQIQGHIVPISSRVSGYIAAIDVDDNELVRAGQPLARLDRRDLDAALRKAEADLANQRAQAVAAGTQVAVTALVAPSTEQQAGAGLDVAKSQVTAASEQIAVAQAQAKSVDAGVQVARDAVNATSDEADAVAAQVSAAEAGQQQAQADVVAAEARAKQSAADLSRYEEMFKAGAVSKQAFDAAEAVNTANQAAVVAAKERVAVAKSAIVQAKARKSAARSQVEQAKSRLVAAVQTAAQAQAGVAVARTNLAQARARLQQAQASLTGSLTAPQQMAISRDQRNAASARAKQAAAAVTGARLQLSYTRIKSPVTGFVSQKTVQLGQYVQPGQMMMAVVPLRSVWVVANFKETQVGGMRVGQRAVISVDAYPEHDIRGRVQSIGAATGGKFSLLPAENATGNFVKVVQRIPVKIVLDRPFPKGAVLRLGMNVVATVDLTSGRG